MRATDRVCDAYDAAHPDNLSFLHQLSQVWDDLYLPQIGAWRRATRSLDPDARMYLEEVAATVRRQLMLHSTKKIYEATGEIYFVRTLSDKETRLLTHPEPKKTGKESPFLNALVGSKLLTVQTQILQQEVEQLREELAEFKKRAERRGMQVTPPSLEPKDKGEELEESLLSIRELQVLLLTVQGMNTSQIASNLHIARSTVRRHFNNAYSKLDASSGAEIIATCATMLQLWREDMGKEQTDGAVRPRLKPRQEIQQAKAQWKETRTVDVVVQHGDEASTKVVYTAPSRRDAEEPKPASPFLEAMTGYVIFQAKDEVDREYHKQHTRESMARSRQKKREQDPEGYRAKEAQRSVN